MRVLSSGTAGFIRVRSRGAVRPFLVALDGRSGAGKSTLARALSDTLNGAVIEGDDFYAGGTGLRCDSAGSRASACIDWSRQRQVLEDLAAGRLAQWRSFDGEAFDGRLCDAPAPCMLASVPRLGREAMPVVCGTVAL